MLWPIMSKSMSTSTITAGTVAVIAPIATDFNKTTIKRCLSESSADQYLRINKTFKVESCTGKMWRDEMIIASSNNDVQPQQNHIDNMKRIAVGKDVRNRRAISDTIDVIIRFAFMFVFIKLEVMQAFQRKIQLEEMWLYKNPRTPDIVSPTVLLLSVIFCPFFTTLLHLVFTGDRRDFRAASWAWTLALCLNGVLTSLLKITVGRPRPDFFYRCFPDGVVILNNLTDLPLQSNVMSDLFNCTGNEHDINEGRKSFPSGHASFAFTGFGFITFYIGAKLHAFNPNGRGESWRLLIAVAPIFVALLTAISRTCDYHHHYLDIIVGSIIGFCITYLVYRQYYPSIFDPDCHRPFQRNRSTCRYLKTTACIKLHKKVEKNGDYDKYREMAKNDEQQSLIPSDEN